MDDGSFSTAMLARSDALPYLDRRHLFHSPEWLAALENGLGFQLVGLLTKHRDLPVAFGLFMEPDHQPFLRIIGTPLPGSFTPYMGPIWLRDDIEDRKVGVILHHHAYLRERGFSYIEWRLRDPALLAALRVHARYQVSTPETFVLPLRRDVDYMWRQLDAKGRKRVRKAERSGVTVVESEGTPAEIEAFAEMLNVVAGRTGMSMSLAPSAALLDALVKHLKPAGRLLILSAVRENRPVAMAWFGYDDVEFHSITAASTPEGFESAANSLLNWEAIKFAATRGCERYDLGGKGIPSIDRFKASFGGVTQQYGRAVWRSTMASVADGTVRMLVRSRWGAALFRRAMGRRQ